MKRHLLLTAVAAGISSSCASVPSTQNLGAGTFAVTITSVNGSSTLPTLEDPFRPTPVAVNDTWGFSIEALTPTGELNTSFDGFVGLSLAPGTVTGVMGTGARANNILLAGGKATGFVQVTNVYGPTNLWVTDLGYVPAPPGTVPECSNGIDDNHNHLVDYPADPGCYAADDNSEDGGSYAAGVSSPVQYRLPTIMDVRGRETVTVPTSATMPCPSGYTLADGVCSYQFGGASTPYQNEAIQVATASPAWLVVTALASDGFYVTDLNPSAVASGYNSLFAYNFMEPEGMAICDRVTSLAGTANDFYGYTQLGFPSYENSYTLGSNGIDVDCRIPPPVDIGASYFTGEKNTTNANLFPIESALVSLTGFTIAKNFGAKLAVGNVFGPGQSNCDFNGDGQIDYTSIPPNCPLNQCEGACANACDDSPDCSEFTSYSARGEYKVHLVINGVTDTSSMIEIDTSVLPTFDPTAHAGSVLPLIVGNLNEFSGGNLNWTVVARCGDDIVCPPTEVKAWGCTPPNTTPGYIHCSAPHTASDNDEGTN
jgi:hypothetical protein